MFTVFQIVSLLISISCGYLKKAMSTYSIEEVSPILLYKAFSETFPDKVLFSLKRSICEG